MTLWPYQYNVLTEMLVVIPYKCFHGYLLAVPYFVNERVLLCDGSTRVQTRPRVHVTDVGNKAQESVLRVHPLF